MVVGFFPYILFMFKTVFHIGRNLLNRGYGRPIFIIKQVNTIFWNGISAFHRIHCYLLVSFYTGWFSALAKTYSFAIFVLCVGWCET